MTILGSSIRERFACWTSSKAPSSVTTMISGMAGDTPLRSRSSSRAATPKHGSCVAGERARPPEDVGGVSGYERFLEIIADQEDAEYAETIQ
nr:hypothetical protein [Rhizobium ruizarguesonis]